MSLIEFLQGFLVVVRPELTISLWAAREVPYQQTLLIVLCWTSITLVIIYFGGANPISKGLKKQPFLRKIIEKWERITNSSKLNVWTSSGKPWIILLLAFLPYTYFVWGLGTTVIAAAKLLNIKYMIVILLLGNACRWAVIIFHIYQIFNIS